MLAITQLSDSRDDIQTESIFRQRECRFAFRAVFEVKSVALRRAASEHVLDQFMHPVESDDKPVLPIFFKERAPANRAEPLRWVKIDLFISLMTSHFLH